MQDDGIWLGTPRQEKPNVQQEEETPKRKQAIVATLLPRFNDSRNSSSKFYRSLDANPVLASCTPPLQRRKSRKTSAFRKISAHTPPKLLLPDLLSVPKLGGSQTVSVLCRRIRWGDSGSVSLKGFELGPVLQNFTKFGKFMWLNDSIKSW